MFADDGKIQKWFSLLDTYQPKNVYGIEVTYVPRDANLTQEANFRDIQAKSRRIDRVSDSHLHFLSMLGKFLNIIKGGEVPSDGNHQLYLKTPAMAKLKDRNVNLLVNEDETNYVSVT